MKSPKFAHATTRFLGQEGEFLLLVTADRTELGGSNEWFVEHKEKILDALDHFGVLYFRGFGADSHGFEAIADVVAPARMPYMGGVSPRHYVHGTVFTASDAPGQLSLAQHHELAYHGSSPRYVLFYCDQKSESGGATPVSCGKRFGRTMDVLHRRVIDELDEKGVLFVRNYHAANFKSWEVTWQTSDRAELENRLRANDTEFEWVSDTHLRTRQRRTAVVRDPVSGQRILYATINIWGRAFFEKVNEAYGLPGFENDIAVQPFATLFGDGTPIPSDFPIAMDKIYDTQKIGVPYENQDFMIINNVIASHGKMPWSGGSRRIYVTLRDPIHHHHWRQMPPRAGAQLPAAMSTVDAVRVARW